ncbi:hypothetical protein CDAR_498071 [Caerostris darwini]|uniref:Secreted protein n=1 Tax=Caerostris darwini TaxID=1538125 RepID=A0AAV4M420_9ARAC|nr:hypothetical protein CDAR_498071 [Caerostris darwini]
MICICFIISSQSENRHLSRSGFEYSRSPAGSDVNCCTVLSPAAEDTDLFARRKTTAEAKVQAQHMSGNWDTFSTRAVRFVHPYSSPSPFFFFVFVQRR